MAARTLFSCRIVDISSYNTVPVKDLDVCYSDFRSSAVAKVPVVRIFGSTPTGQKTCLHVHGVFPYIFVPSPVTDPTPSYLQQLATSIDQALHLSLGNNGLKHADRHHVFKISVVKGTPMYGYRAREELFLKIHLYNPSMVKRLSELLVAGVVMGTVLQPHEAHIPFVLQMMIDYNLYGMNFVHLSSVKFRAPREGVSPDRRSRSRSFTSPLVSPAASSRSHSTLVLSPSQQVWDVDSLPGSMLVCIPRVSECELEVDALAADILNPQQISHTGVSFPGLAAVWEEERDRRKLLGLDEQLTPPPSPDRECCTTELPEMTASLASIIDERLRKSVSSQNEVDLSVSSSCDHRPIKLQDSPGIARQLSMSGAREHEVGGEWAGPVVDEEAIYQSMELSQRLRIESLRKSTDVELLDLLLELAQTPSPAATATQQQQQQLSQSIHQTKTVADSLSSHFTHSHPLPRHPHSTLPPHLTKTSVTGSKTSLTSSQPVTRPGIHTRKEEEDEEMNTVDFLVRPGKNQNNQLSNRNDLSINSAHSTAQQLHSSSDEPEKLVKPVKRGGSPHNNSSSPNLPGNESPLLSEADLFSGDSSPLFLSPPPEFHRETCEGVSSVTGDEGGVNGDNHLSVMLNSGAVAVGNDDERGETPDLMRQFDDIPCAQRQLSQMTSPSPADGESDAVQDVLNSSGTPDGNFASEVERSSVAVQLEFEMPEISLSQFESFQSSTTEILGTPSKMMNTGGTTAQRKSNKFSLKEVNKEGTLGVNKEIVAADGERYEGVKETPDNAAMSVANSEGSASSSVAPGNTRAAVWSARKLPLEASTPSRRGDDWGARGRERERGGSISLSSSQRRVLLRQLSCASGELGDLSEGGEGVSEQEDDDDDESGDEWLSGDWSTQLLTIPESPQEGRIGQQGSPIRGLDSSTTRMGNRIGQLDGPPDYLKHKKSRSGEENKKRSKMSLSLAPSHRKRRRSIRTNPDSHSPLAQHAHPHPSPLAPLAPLAHPHPSPLAHPHTSPQAPLAHPPLSPQAPLAHPPLSPPLTSANVNSHPLAEKWKLNAVKHPPSISLPRITTIRPATQEREDRYEIDRKCEGQSQGTTMELTAAKKMKMKKIEFPDIPGSSSEREGSHATAADISDAPDSTPDISNSATEISDTPDISSSTPDISKAANSATDTSEAPYISNSASEISEAVNSTPEVSESAQSAQRRRKRRRKRLGVGGKRYLAEVSWPRKRRRKSVRETKKKEERTSDVVERESEIRCDEERSSCDEQSAVMAEDSEKSVCAKDSPQLTLHSESIASSGDSRHDDNVPVSGSHDNSFHGDSILEVIPDPERAERELSPENGNETVDVSSETSSQIIESDFNLIVTESESGEDDVLPIEQPREGAELVVGRHGDDGDRHGDSVRERCTFASKTSVSPSVPLSHSKLEDAANFEISAKTAPMRVNFGPPRILLKPLRGPPRAGELVSTAARYGLSAVRHTAPFYSNPADTHPAREANGRLLKVPSNMVSELPEAQPVVLEEGVEGVKSGATPLSAIGLHHWETVLSMLSGDSESTEIVSPAPPYPPWEPKTTTPHPLHTTDHHKHHGNKTSSKRKLILTPLKPPPHPRDVKEWVNAKITAKRRQNESKNESVLQGRTHQECNQPINVTLTPFSLKKDTSGLEGPTPQNMYGFKISQSALATSSHTHEYLTTMSVELHIRTRGCLKPDPECDPVLSVFYYIHHDYPPQNFDGQSEKKISQNHIGVIAIDIENCGFQGVHVSRETKKNASPRKLPVSKHPHVDLSSNRPTTLSDQSHNDSATSNQAAVAPANGGVQSSRTLTSTMVAMGYLGGCVGGEGVKVTYVTSESELFDQLVAIVRRHDPDILLGYEVTMMSWGYLIDRAAALKLNLTNQLSRTPHQPEQRSTGGGSDSGTGTRHKPQQSPVRIPGRIVVNVWRQLRKELALTSYSFESTFFQVMHQRIPMFQFQILTQWYEMGTLGKRAEVVDYYLLRCRGNYQMLEKLNVIGRTSEFARLYGIEFENVLSRGSQYRVESMLLRLAKPANYIAISPNIQQRARMAAPECIPLILEPESKFYSDPVLVLDFQSLYPSIVIGYNYCYTTCLGRVGNLALDGHFTFGTNTLNIPTHVLKRVRRNLTVSPNGVAFVDPSIRKGLMPRMLEEILGTRIMVKSSMKKHSADKALNRILDARQMGLKLIANVTYGYAAASFSGRMPCVEVADSIVGKARETLERAIRLISETKKWRARVVYGDTDSVFVLLRGVSKDEAFRIGRDICECVTGDNPKPVKLKFEKVYYPCILQTKKRYCGYMYETPDQREPVYDAKGIETVRRDTCPAVAKTLQKSLSLLFSTFDLSQVKRYVQRQLSKLLDGRTSIQDHILAKEYRGRGHYRPGACVPSLELARRGMASDPRAEPRAGERVPYVVVYGHPGQPLIQLVRSPLEVAKDPTLRLNGVYYITKQVLPALDRALSLLGVDVYQWYKELPRVIRAPLPPIQETTDRKLKGTLGQYFATVHCLICNELTNEGVCLRCRGDPQKVATMLSQQIHDLESAHHSVTMLCHSCTGSSDPTLPNNCLSLDCPVFYRRLHTLHTLPTVTKLTKLLTTTLPRSP